MTPCFLYVIDLIYAEVYITSERVQDKCTAIWVSIFSEWEREKLIFWVSTTTLTTVPYEIFLIRYENFRVDIIIINSDEQKFLIWSENVITFLHLIIDCLLRPLP